MADRGDAVVVLAGGKAGDAVFFRVHAHAAEFEDVEFLAVFGQALLSVEGCAAVSADEDGDDDHQRGQDDEGDAGHQEVKGSFDNEEFGCRVVALQHQDRQVEHVDGVGALHEEVADPGDDVGPDVLFDAVFDDLVAVVAVDAAEEDRLGLVEVGEVVDDFIDIDGLNNIEALGQAVGADQVFHALAHVPDDDGLDGFEFAEILSVDHGGPDKGQEDLRGQGDQHGDDVGQTLGQEPGHEVHDGVREQDGQGLAVDDLRHVVDGDGES